MAGLDENRIRLIIQEEIAREKNSRQSVSSVYHRTQELVNATASTIVSEYSNVTGIANAAASRVFILVSSASRTTISPRPTVMSITRGRGQQARI